MICVRCKERPSTGILMALCDECFDRFEAEVDAGERKVGFNVKEAVTDALNDRRNWVPRSELN